MAACSIQDTLASIFQRLRIVEVNQSRSNAAIAKVKMEMEDASSRIHELECSHESALREINSLLQRFGEQMTAARRKEQEKLRSAFLRLRDEIEEERNTCRLLKVENNKLMEELKEANNVAADTGEELDRERQARELMEEVCNELAREIGEDKAEVEQLKQEQAKSREMVEEELKMMRMASLWRDESVRTGTSGAVDEKQQMGMPLQELKRKIEEFVSTVSEVGSETGKDPMHMECIQEKQQKIIKQAKMLRQALELSMKQQLGDGGGRLDHVQDDFNVREEKILTPITQDQHTHNNGNCYPHGSSIPSPGSKIPDCKEQSKSHIDRIELQIKPSNYMLSYSKKPFKDTRRPRSTSADDHDYHPSNARQQPRKHILLHDRDMETSLDMGSGNIIVENDHVQALHQSPSPEHCMYDSSNIWLTSEKHRNDRGLPGVSCSDANELQIHGSHALQRSLSSHHKPLKGLHRRQSSLHFDPSREGLGENADLWQGHVSSSMQEKSFSEDEASHVVCTDEASKNSRQGMKRRPTNCIYRTQHVDDLHSWKRTGEEDMRNDDDVALHAECLMQHEYEEAKSLCVGGKETDGQGDFDGFYYEPVMDADAVGVHSIQYVQEEDVDDHLGMADDEERSVSNIYKSTQQSRSPKQFTKPLVQDGHYQTPSRHGGASIKASGREDAPHKLVVPTPTIRVPLVKTQFTISKGARSVSPSKPQVLQCFRPPPTSPEHHIAPSAAPVFSKSHAKASIEAPQLVMEAQNSGNSSIHTSKATVLNATSCSKAYPKIGQEGAPQRSSKAGDGKASRSELLEEKKDNSLRTELLKARETDLQQYVEHVHYNMQKQAEASAPPEKRGASSSFRFSPLRKSLTSNSH